LALIEEAHAVVEDSFAVIAATHQVVNGAGIFDA